MENALDFRTYFYTNSAKEITGSGFPEGNSIRDTTDARNNVVTRTVTAKGSSAPALVSTWTYPTSCTPTTRATCNKPITFTNPSGGVTNYTYNSRGQVLTIASPAPSAGATRPTVTYSYAMRTAYVLNANGAAVAAGDPISLLTRQSECRTQYPCAGTADEVVTDYDYGPTTGVSNLLLRGITVTSDGQTRRTCYGYNYFGEKISETPPAAGLASCP